MISGDIESNPGPVAHGTSTHTAHTILRIPSIALLQARIAQKGLKSLESTSDGSCFFSSVFHQLYNDPSYHMNVNAAGVESIRNNRQKLLDPLQSNCDLLSQQHTWCDALIVQAVCNVL